MTRNDARLHQMLEAERAALLDLIGHYEVLTGTKSPVWAITWPTMPRRPLTRHQVWRSI